MVAANLPELRRARASLGEAGAGTLPSTWEQEGLG